MKKLIVCVIMFLIVFGYTFSENIDEWNWGGLVRFRPLATVFGLATGGIEIVATWIPYVTPSIGIPVEIDFFTIAGITGFGVAAGIEVIPVRHKEKSGLYLTALVGPMILEQYISIFGRANIGYQIVTDGGFVFTPAIGAKYNGFTGFALDLMLDIGFGYRKK